MRVSNKRSFGDPRIRENRSSCDPRRRPSRLRIKEASQVDPTRLFFGELKVTLQGDLSRGRQPLPGDHSFAGNSANLVASAELAEEVSTTQISRASSMVLDLSKNKNSDRIRAPGPPETQERPRTRKAQLRKGMHLTAPCSLHSVPRRSPGHIP